MKKVKSKIGGRPPHLADLNHPNLVSPHIRHSCFDRKADRGAVALLPTRSSPVTMTIGEIDAEIARLLRTREELAGPHVVLDRTSFQRVLSVVARACGVEREKILGRSRAHLVVRARHCAMVLLQDLTDASSSSVGTAMGRDHGTVLHARRSIRNQWETEPEFRVHFSMLRFALGLPTWDERRMAPLGYATA